MNFKLNKSNRSIVQYGLGAVVSVAVISWVHIRPLGILFLVLFSFWLCKTRWNLHIEMPADLKNKIIDALNSIRVWRTNNPVMFCSVTSVCLGALAILGHLISGSAVVLIGLIIAALVSTKYNLKIIKIEPKDFDWSENLNHDAELDDEFIPEVNEANLFVLERASDMALLSSPTTETDEEKSDDIPSELLIPDAIPEIDERSSDDDDENIIPLVASASQHNENRGQAVDEIEFRKGHFKRDSSLSTSSSSEESLSKGLKFPDHTTVDGSIANRKPSGISGPHNQEASDIVALALKAQTQALIASSSRIVPTLMTGLMQWSAGADVSSNSIGNKEENPKTATSAFTNKKPPNRQIVAESSDESDFEILDNDDFI